MGQGAFVQRGLHESDRSMYAASAPRSQPAARNGSIDILRFAGAIGIIWFHLDLPGAGTALSALPMFVALFVCFGMGRSRAALQSRLLTPWLFWSAIFIFAKVGQALVSGAPLASEFATWMFFAGPSIHLWFLPFSYLFVRLMQRVPRDAWLPLAIVLVPASLWLANGVSLPQPFAQWATVIPAAFMGLMLHSLGPNSLRAHNFGWMSVACAAVLALSGLEQVAYQYVLGMSAMLMALAVPMPQTQWCKRAAETSFGLYLLHPLIVAGALYIPLNSMVLQTLIVVGASIVLTQMVRKVTPAMV